MVLPFLRGGLSSSPNDDDREAVEQYRLFQDRPWWFQTAREVRENDEAKVRDYKEDIDTLLVIGALFSAVITALMIESYKSLNQDPADLSVQTLLHLSQQFNSFMTDGHSSGDTPPAFTLPTFTPSKAMVIANVTWFGSLVISLMAASYGMLVKQWLREFLANRDASPLTRLRIRSFRYPALAKWKVFEIVAVLPLLLQISLGLFFVGLCYFASTIHPAVQWTVIPLVGIWAFLFLLVTFAPVVSARCPYKTTFLKNVLKKVRRGRYALTYKIRNLFSNPSLPEEQNVTTQAVGFPSSQPASSLPPPALGRDHRTTTHTEFHQFFQRARSVMWYKLMRSPAENASEPKEEDDIVKNDVTDIDVLAQVDFMQCDDGLITPALVDLGRQQAGPDLISFVFAILGHRDSDIIRTNFGTLIRIQGLSTQLSRAVATALVEALRYERRKVLSSQSAVSQLIRWDDWVQDSCRILLMISKHSGLTSQANYMLSECLSIAHPNFIDDLIGPVMACKNSLWDWDQSMTIIKDILHSIDPSHNHKDDTLPFKLDNLSLQTWKQVTSTFASFIVSPGTTPCAPHKWNPESTLAFRIIFGESLHDAPEDIYEKIHDGFGADELIERLLSTISSLRVQGYGRRVASYIFHLLYALHGTSDTFDLSYLSEESWSTVSRLLVAVLTDEWTVRRRTEPVEEEPEWESCILDVIYVIFSTTGHPTSEDGVRVIASLFALDPEGLSNKLVAYFTNSGAEPLSSTIPTLLRSLANTCADVKDPWTVALRIPTRSSQHDMLANITSKCLTAKLQASTTDTPEKWKWVLWAVHIILSCGEASQNFSGSTLSAINKLIQSYAHTIVNALPSEEGDNPVQLERLWKVIQPLEHSQKITFIATLWPKTSSRAHSALPMHLLRKLARDEKQTTTEVFLNSPPEFHKTRVEAFVAHHIQHSRSLSREHRPAYLDELQLISQLQNVEAAWNCIKSIATQTTQIRDPRWPEWMKTFIAKSSDVKIFQTSSELSKNLKTLLCYDASESILLFLSKDIGIHRIPSNVLTLRGDVGCSERFVLPTFPKYPESLCPETAENTIMRLLLNANIDQPVHYFSTHDYFDDHIPPPRYVCVSLALRVIRYYLTPKGIHIPTKDIRLPLDLTQLVKSVWDDVASAAAAILNNETRTGIDNDYGGGVATYNMARSDAMMILLAGSPHPLPTDLSYQVLEKEMFFRWEDNEAIELHTRQELEGRRLARIEEGRRRFTGSAGASSSTNDLD